MLRKPARAGKGQKGDPIDTGMLAGFGLASTACQLNKWSSVLYDHLCHMRLDIRSDMSYGKDSCLNPACAGIGQANSPLRRGFGLY